MRMNLVTAEDGNIFAPSKTQEGFAVEALITVGKPDDQLKLAPVGKQRMPVIMRRVTAASMIPKLFHTLPPSLCNRLVESAINLLCPILTFSFLRAPLPSL